MLIEYISMLQEWFNDISGIELVLKGAIWYLAFFWCALVIWVARDAINRSNSLIFHVFSILLNIFLPVFGLIIYLLIRPTRTLLDKYYEDLEFQALSGSDSKDYCPKCQAIVEKDFKFCGSCGSNLSVKCEECNEEFMSKFKICPHCGTKKGKKSKKK